MTTTLTGFRQVCRSITRIVVGTAAAVFALTVSFNPAASQSSGSYPTKPVQIILSVPPGSAVDIIGRLVGDMLGRRWGQQAVVVNKPGAGGVIAAESVARAAPDGYTLLLASASLFTVTPATMDSLPIDPAKQLAPVGLVGEIPLVIAVAPSLGVASIKELVDKGKATPGKVHYAANNTGSLPHLAGELFNARTGATLNFIPYKGTAQALQDINGGQLSIIIEGVSGLSSALQAGTIKSLAVTTQTRLPNFPDLPTVAESVPGFAAVGWTALMAPAGVPSDIVQKLNSDLRKALESPELKRKFEDLGTYVRATSAPELATFIQSEASKWLPIARQLGLKAQ